MARQRDEMLPPRTEGGKGDCRKVPNAQDGREVTMSSRLGCWECVPGWLGEMRKLEDACGCACQHPCAPAENEVEDEEQTALIKCQYLALC